MTWLDYDEQVDSLSTMDNEVGVTSPESTTQTLSSFKEYTPIVTYPKEVEKTSGTPIEVEPLNQTKLEEVGLNCNHNTPFSSRDVFSFDGPEPQPLLNNPSLDVSLGDVIGLEPPIKPYSSDSSRMKVVNYLTTQTPASPHVANSHPKGVYSYYNPGIDDLKRHYGLKPGLLGKSVSLGNFSSKTKNEFSQTVETASRFTRDAITTTTMMGQDILDGVKRPVTGKLKNFKHEKRHSNVPPDISPCFRMKEGDHVTVSHYRYVAIKDAYDRFQAKLAELNGGLIKEPLRDAGDASQRSTKQDWAEWRNKYISEM
nr:40S ribosomal protein S11-like [Tanacetum cinerariifolium]